LHPHIHWKMIQFIWVEFVHNALGNISCYCDCNADMSTWETDGFFKENIFDMVIETVVQNLKHGKEQRKSLDLLMHEALLWRLTVELYAVVHGAVKLSMLMNLLCSNLCLTGCICLIMWVSMEIFMI
jgi:hypothetical protein